MPCMVPSGNNCSWVNGPVGCNMDSNPANNCSRCNTPVHHLCFLENVQGCGTSLTALCFGCAKEDPSLQLIGLAMICCMPYLCCNCTAVGTGLCRLLHMHCQLSGCISQYLRCILSISKIFTSFSVNCGNPDVLHVVAAAPVACTIISVTLRSVGRCRAIPSTRCFLGSRAPSPS